MPRSMRLSAFIMIASREHLLQTLPTKLPPPTPLTTTGSSWVLHLPRLVPSPDRATFESTFQSHPPDKHALKLFGKKVLENRFSQFYVTDESVGSTYSYSGSSRSCVVCRSDLVEEQFVLDLCELSNVLLKRLVKEGVQSNPLGAQDDDIEENSKMSFYNACLVNWYQPDHHIGLHADDERELNLHVPIVCLSWGGPRRFLLKPKTATKNAKSKVHEVLLRDGDLLLMGGNCQMEFKHEIPRVRKMDDVVGKRISWTIRSMKTNSQRKRVPLQESEANSPKRSKRA